MVAAKETYDYFLHTITSFKMSPTSLGGGQQTTTAG